MHSISLSTYYVGTGVQKDISVPENIRDSRTVSQWNTRIRYGWLYFYIPFDFRWGFKLRLILFLVWFSESESDIDLALWFAYNLEA